MNYEWRRYLTFQQFKKKRVLEVWATKYFKKVKTTGRVDRYGQEKLEKTTKKLKLKSQDLGNLKKRNIEVSKHFNFGNLKHIVGAKQNPWTANQETTFIGQK